MSNENPKMTIELNQAGQVTVQGPLSNKLLCYGMLKMAEQIIFEYGKKEVNRVTVPHPADLVKFRPKG